MHALQRKDSKALEVKFFIIRSIKYFKKLSAEADYLVVCYEIRDFTVIGHLLQDFFN